MRIATYNVEWFNALFDHDGHILDDAGPSARYGVTRADQLAGLGIVFTAMNADAVLVVEAPDQNRRRTTAGQLEAFAAMFGLRTRKAVAGFPSETEQEIALLYDPERLSAVHDPQGVVDTVEEVRVPVGHVARTSCDLLRDVRDDCVHRIDLDATVVDDRDRAVPATVRASP